MQYFRRKILRTLLDCSVLLQLTSVPGKIISRSKVNSIRFRALFDFEFFFLCVDYDPFFIFRKDYLMGQLFSNM